MVKFCPGMSGRMRALSGTTSVNRVGFTALAGWRAPCIHQASAKAATRPAATRAALRQARRGPVGDGPADDPAPVYRALTNVVLPSASANALALSKRSAGSFSSDCATAAATLGGTDFRYFVTGSAGSAMIFMITCCAEAPVCGGLPASIS